MFALYILEQQEKNDMDYNNRFMHRKGPQHVTASVFPLGICVQNVVTWMPGVLV